MKRLTAPLYANTIEIDKVAPRPIEAHVSYRWIKSKRSPSTIKPSVRRRIVVLNVIVLNAWPQPVGRGQKVPVVVSCLLGSQAVVLCHDPGWLPIDLPKLNSRERSNTTSEDYVSPGRSGIALEAK